MPLVFIFNKLLPAITGRALTELDKQVIELPVRYGGMGIRNPRTTADEEYKTPATLQNPWQNKYTNKIGFQNPT